MVTCAFVSSLQCDFCKVICSNYYSTYYYKIIIAYLDNVGLNSNWFSKNCISPTIVEPLVMRTKTSKKKFNMRCVI